MKTFRKLNLGFALASAFGLLLMWSQWGEAATVSILSTSQVPYAPAVRNVETRDNVVTGEIVNNSANRVRDVELLIRNVWHWRNEFRPGENPPGSADFYTVRAEIPSGSTERFNYTLPPPSTRPDGYFETVVTVAGFTEVLEASQEQKNINDWRPLS